MVRYLSGVALQASFFCKTFYFHFKVRTSRGEMPDRTSWFVKIGDPTTPSHFGLGEAAPLPGLSAEYTSSFETTLSQMVDRFNAKKIEKNALRSQNIHTLRVLWQKYLPDLPAYSAILFAFEMALLDFTSGGCRIVFENNSFLRGTPIPINGLIWMDEVDAMWQKVQEIIKKGFRCIKIKVGGSDFDRECAMLQRIRSTYSYRHIELRLDANGAFHAGDIYAKLSELHRFNIHSIEQPLPPGRAEMASVCENSPIPIALDEELIGIMTYEQKEDLLRQLNPAFIVLKPTLHGGLQGCDEWVRVADMMGIGWWVTSALESNVGLNAIAQFVGCFDHGQVQGLGTGGIYTNNFTAPLLVTKGMLIYDRSSKWQLDT